jgi:polysaccharide deacetylase family protein (PEP-CTERM system associated)
MNHTTSCTPIRLSEQHRRRTGGHAVTDVSEPLTTVRPNVVLLAALSFSGVFACAVGDDAFAACNLIPGTAKTFNSVLGATNRPFAAPGEPLEIRFRSCDTGSPGFLATGAEHVVTIVFEAPDGTERVVALATDCTGVDTATCAGLPDVDSAVCLPAPGLATRIDVSSGDRRLVFPFPDTDDQLGAPGDGIGLSGPATIAVTPKVDPLPCGLASHGYAAEAGTLACIDDLYLNDGACGTVAKNDVFPRFTALPLPNEYVSDCFREPPCTAGATAVRAAVDADGNLLMPIVWQGVLTRGRRVEGLESQGLPRRIENDTVDSRGAVAAQTALRDPEPAVMHSCALTVDVEDWYHPELVRNRVRAADARSVVERGTNAVLDLLKRHDARATFFVLGDVAARMPALVRRIAGEGHEIACHGMTHRPLRLLDRESFRQELRDFRAAIRAALGEDTSIGFRAPTFSLDANTTWALSVLADEGFRYDSSIFPRRVRLYGVNGAPLGIYRPDPTDLRRDDPRGALVEFPVAVASAGGVRIPAAGGFYLRALPATALTASLDHIRARRPFALYVHPWECVTDLPRVRLPIADAIISYFGLDSVMPKLERILSRFGSVPMREILEEGSHLASATA